MTPGYAWIGHPPGLIKGLGHDGEMIELYRWKIRAAEKIEPIEVYCLSPPNRPLAARLYELYDGHHRLEAHRLEGIERIAVVVKTIGLR